MGTGGPLEAAYTLKGPIREGTWTLVADGIVIEPVRVRFELIWRSGAGDSPIATWEHDFPMGTPPEYLAIPFEASAAAPEVPAQAGDELVFRYSVVSGATVMMAYIPNGDGEEQGGRIPYVDLP